MVLDIQIQPNHHESNFMGHDNVSVVPSTVMWNKRDGPLSIPVRAIIDQKIPMLVISKFDISLTKRIALDGLEGKVILHSQKVNQHIMDILKVDMILRRGLIRAMTTSLLRSKAS